jgi:uncharacterized metal-binding protein YceD (DUF177 family)
MTKRTSDPAPEFSRPLEVARVPKLGSHEKLVADARECEALARRLKVPAVHGVSAALHVKAWRGGGYKVSGEATIDLEQESVISLEAFRSQQTVEIERYFLDALASADADEEHDIEPIPGGVIDLGEIVAETIALELDPYPRKPGEVFEAPPEDEFSKQPEKANPFKVLLQPGRK